MDRAEPCIELLRRHFGEGRHLVVGLDPVIERIPESVAPDASPAERVVEFKRRIVAATASVTEAFLIAASRSILYASSGEDFAEAAHAAAESLHAEIAAA